MKGKHHITVQNNRLRYEMDIRRNITIIRGDSATGKTTLIQMLDQFANLGEESGIDVICDKEIQILSGRNWKGILDSLENQILFLDEQPPHTRAFSHELGGLCLLSFHKTNSIWYNRKYG